MMKMLIGNHIIYRFVLPVLTSNMFVILGKERAIIIDPFICSESEKILKEKNVKNILIILTHEHIDHVSGVNWYRSWSEENEIECKVICSHECCERITKPDGNLAAFFYGLMIKKSKEEAEIIDEYFKSDYVCSADAGFEIENEFQWCDLQLVLKETPGHSPGSICIEIYSNDDERKLLALATGDSLVQGNKVITRLPGGSKKSYQEVVRPYLESFPGDTLVLPGHGEISLMKDLELG